MSRWTSADLESFGKRVRGNVVDTVIGIDPGKNTGFAVFDKNLGKLLVVESLDFWGVYAKSLTYDKSKTRVIVEVSRSLGVWTGGKTGDVVGNIKKATKVGANVGGVNKEGKLMAEGLRRMGYEVKEVHPRGKVDAAKFKQLTGYAGRTNEHGRDAGMLAFNG